MRRILILAAILLAGVSAAWAQDASDLKYYDVKECGFPLANQGFDDCVGYYGRMSASLEGQLRDYVWYLAKNNAGMAVRFRTNATTIGAKWTVINNFRMNHMAPTGICGLDLYGYDEGTWKYVGTAVPGNTNDNQKIFRSHIDGKMRDYVVFLPLYDGVSEIAIGVEEGAVIEQPTAIGNNLFGGKAEKPIVFFGHSGCQGGCASRPGMLHTNILSRKLKRECINLGFSGMGQMYTIMAREVAKIDAGAYVLDCLGNNYLQMTRDSSEVFIKTIADKHPDTPLFLLTSYAYASEWIGTDPESESPIKDQFWIDLCAKLNKEGYKNIKMIDLRGPHKKGHNPLEGSSAGPDGEGTVDGGHLTDLGFQRLADFLYPYFKKLK